MEVKFNNVDFDFYRSGVMVLERSKNGVSIHVVAFTHEPFNLSSFKFLYVDTDDKMQVKFDIDNFLFHRSSVMVLVILPGHK